MRRRADSVSAAAESGQPAGQILAEVRRELPLRGQAFNYVSFFFFKSSSFMRAGAAKVTLSAGKTRLPFTVRVVVSGFFFLPTEWCRC